MSNDRKYDIVVFGATAFTGKFVVREMLETSGEMGNVKWAIAGRNLDKMTYILEESKKYVEGVDFPTVDIIVANVDDYESLVSMAQQTKIVINIVGPYGVYGEAVVRACVENCTTHLDISGEPSFLEEMQLKYNAKARENNVHVIGSLGFDSVPADVGLEYFRRRFDGHLIACESYLDFNSGTEVVETPYVHTGTWESILNSLRSSTFKKIASVRSKLFDGRLKYPLNYLKKRKVHFSDAGKASIPFMGSDKSVVQRTQRFNVENGVTVHPVQYLPYMEYNHWFNIVGLFIAASFYYLLLCLPFGEYLLKRMKNSKFCVRFLLYGSSDRHVVNKVDKTVVAKVCGPNAGYIGTARMIATAAYTVLLEGVPGINGGVLTPAAALINTSFVNRLEKRGFKFTMEK